MTDLSISVIIQSVLLNQKFMSFVASFCEIDHAYQIRCESYFFLTGKYVPPRNRAAAHLAEEAVEALVVEGRAICLMIMGRALIVQIPSRMKRLT